MEMFTPCMVDLCKALWEVMKSYHKTMQWHDRYYDKETSSPENGMFYDILCRCNMYMTGSEL